MIINDYYYRFYQYHPPSILTSYPSIPEEEGLHFFIFFA